MAATARQRRETSQRGILLEVTGKNRAIRRKSSVSEVNTTEVCPFSEKSGLDDTSRLPKAGLHAFYVALPLLNAQWMPWHKCSYFTCDHLVPQTTAGEM
jgi:hypothetical protein